MGIFSVKHMKGPSLSVALYYKDRGINIMDDRFDSALAQSSLSVMEYQALVGVSGNGMLIKRDTYNRVGGFDVTLISDGNA
jgi:GT2 family glycosyltransferase